MFDDSSQIIGRGLTDGWEFGIEADTRLQLIGPLEGAVPGESQQMQHQNGGTMFNHRFFVSAILRETLDNGRIKRFVLYEDRQVSNVTCENTK